MRNPEAWIFLGDLGTAWEGGVQGALANLSCLGFFWKAVKLFGCPSCCVLGLRGSDLAFAYV